MRPSANDVWPVVHAERRRLVADLSGLTPEQWATPSLCPGWDVHDVVAHLVDSARTGRLGFVRDMLQARLDFDRANEHGVARERRPDPRDTLATLAHVADLTRTPPANLATRLVEAVVHALTYQLRTPVGFGGGRERAAGLRLVDTATGTAWGAGHDVVGDMLDLLLAVSGRPVPHGSLDGPGADRLRTADHRTTDDRRDP